MDNRSPHILLVEDNSTDVLLLEEALRQPKPAVFAVTHASRLDEALRCMRVERFDAVLLDLGLPDSQGFDTFLRMQNEHPAMPILIVSNLDDSELAARAVKNGAQDYLVKGVFHSTMLGRNIRYGIERKLSEQRLVASEMGYRRLFETAQDGIFILDAETGQITDANPFLEDLLGHTAAEFKGKRLWEISPFRDKAASKAAFHTLQEKGYIRYDDLPLATKDGRFIDVEFISNVYAVGAQQVIQCNIRDISARKRAEEALRHSHDLLELRVLERTAELVGSNEALVREVAERLIAMNTLRDTVAQLEFAKRDLETARENAERANLAKSEFLSRMSHELRTPLNAILGFGQILDRGNLTPRQTESVGHILKGGRHLLNLINEVLDIARVEAGHVDLSIEPIALADVVPESCALVQPLADNRSIRIEENSATLENRYVLADRQRLKQVLINLLSNGIKYNRTGGQVEVAYSELSESWIAIAIRDSGPGISHDDLPRLFTPFERLGAANSDIEGTGLGLALSQRLVTAMGGTLEVESTLGQGSTFTIRLPATKTPIDMLPGSSGIQREIRTGEAHRYTVLSIEDNVSNLRLLEVILDSRPEITLLSAMRGSMGLDLASQHEPDLILLDLNLPDLSGMQVLTTLRESAGTRDIPVIIISADATPVQMERLLAAGARAYLTKPLDVEQFLTVLDDTLEGDIQ